MRIPAWQVGLELFVTDLTASPDGTWITMGDMTLSGRDGYYQGSYVEDGWYYTWRINVLSPTVIVGEWALAQIGEPCSATVPAYFQYLG